MPLTEIPAVAPHALRIVICEDNKDEMALLCQFLERMDHVRVIGRFEDGKTALESLPELAPDLLLLDISMPGASGIEIAEILEERKRLPYTVFITSDEKFALKAFDLGAVDYILKPLTMPRLNKAIERAEGKISQRNGNTKNNVGKDYYFKYKDSHYLVPYEKIIYIESNGRNTKLYTDTQVYEIAMLLKKVESKLPSDIFFRIHKKYVVNIRFISHIKYNASGSYLAHLHDGKGVLPVSSKNSLSLKKNLQKL